MDWLEKELKRYTYRPGWSFHIRRPFNNYDIFGDGKSFTFYGSGPVLVMQAYVTNSYPPHEKIKVTATRPVPYLFDDKAPVLTEAEREREFAHWFAEAVLEIERHEMQEWLRRDGELVDDPHKNDRKRS